MNLKKPSERAFDKNEKTRITLFLDKKEYSKLYNKYKISDKKSARSFVINQLLLDGFDNDRSIIEKFILYFESVNSIDNQLKEEFINYLKNKI